MAVTDGLTRALEDSGLSQADFAAALGTSASRFSTYRTGRTMPTAEFYLRALELAENLRAAHERGWMTPHSVTREVRRGLRDGDETWALKMVLQGRDHLKELLRRGDRAVGAWCGGPRSTGSRQWDAFLGAVVHHEFEAAGQQPPDWGSHVLTGDDLLLIPSLLLDDSEVRRATPAWLAERGVYAAERDLATA